MVNDKWVVITSIYAPNKRLIDFLENGWSIVVVADVKTPNTKWASFNYSELHFLSVELQKRMFPELSSKIGFGTYSRKNLGYIYAKLNGATVIYDTDDDTFLREEGNSCFLEVSNVTQGRVFGDGFFNPYRVFAKDLTLWPRGYPLSRIARDRISMDDNVQIIEKTEINDFDILQTLVNLEPDLDAIFRLTNQEIHFDFDVDPRIFKLEGNIFAPGNTQSTFWLNRSKFKYLYVPSFVSFRFCDILKMYIAQTFCSLAYTGFWSEQIRNPHDYLEDFKSEIECYLAVEKLVEILKKLEDSSLTDVYKTLSEYELVSVEEAEIAHLFELEMQK